MLIAFDKPSSLDLRPFGVPRRDPGPAIMEIITTDDKSKSLPPYSGPPPPMHRIPPHDGPHGLPSAPGLYDHSWRGYHSSFDNHPPEQRRTSNAPQPSLPSHGYRSMQGRELPQLVPPDGPYGRPGSLPAPTHTPTEPPPPPPPHTPFHPMNGAPHEPAPHSAPPDYRPRMSFPPQEPQSNGEPPPPHSLPPSQYAATVPPPPSHTPAPYDSNYYQNPAFGMRQRKAARAQQACDQCRARKAKCDEGRPACSHCKENNLVCVYKEVPPHKQEKATQLILDRMQQMEDKIEDRMSQFQKIQLEHTLWLSQIQPQVKDGVILSNSNMQKPSLNPFLKTDVAEVPQESEPKDQAASTSGQKMDLPNGLEQQLLQTGEDGELSIPVEHTTAAHKLLAWPTIKALLKPHSYDEDYVMKLEEERGLIRIYGRGEGDESSEDKSTPPSLNTSWDERYSPGGNWNATVKANGSSPKPEVEGINKDGILSIDGDTIRGFRHSYMEHIHRLHPFLDQQDLDSKIEQFISTYCPKSPSQSGTMLNSSNSADAPRGAKRKRSCENLQGSGYNMQSPTSTKPDGPISVEKSINNAIILLVLALGRICQVRNVAIRGPITDYVLDYRKQYIPETSPQTRIAISPSGSDSILAQQSSFYSSFQNRSFSSSVADNNVNVLREDRFLRNVDAVPGLVYYAYATQILGGLQGVNTLPHVQAALLAGLYAGQLAHPFQSHGWINQAARACQVLVRSKRYEKLQEGQDKDLVNFAYWTCLQLESDILAELDLPASGISRSEARIALPKGRFTLSLPNDISAPSTIMMFFYSAQIHLRKILNRVHTDLYKVEKQGQTRWSSNVQEILSMNLDLWRASLPEVMRWKDTDPPSDDINVARMRGKYYGARYIIHRPLLYHALHYSGPNVPTTSVDSPAGSAISGSKSQQVSPSMTHSQRATNMSRMSSDMGLMGRNSGNSTQPGGIYTHTYRDLPHKLRRACKVCVDSAILSTEAFDGVQASRPVVTNIFGTAHAQFGNMLVLSTTYMSHLSELVDRNDLDRLLKRTIGFLLQSRNISPTLRADAKILTEIYEKIFLEPPVITTT